MADPRSFLHKGAKNTHPIQRDAETAGGGWMPDLERCRDCRWGLDARQALVTCFQSDRGQSNLPKIFAKQITLQSRARRAVFCLPGQMSLFYPSAPGIHSDMVSCMSHLSTPLHWLEVKSQKMQVWHSYRVSVAMLKTKNDALKFSSTIRQLLYLRVKHNSFKIYF